MTENVGMAAKILSAMSQKNMSYGELSALTGIPKSALQRYATGTTGKIPLDRVEAIALALDISAAYLMGWADEKTTLSPVQQQAMNAILNMSEEQLKAFLKLMGEG